MEPSSSLPSPRLDSFGFSASSSSPTCCCCCGGLNMTPTSSSSAATATSATKAAMSSCWSRVSDVHNGDGVGAKVVVSGCDGSDCGGGKSVSDSPTTPQTCYCCGGCCCCYSSSFRATPPCRRSTSAVSQRCHCRHQLNRRHSFRLSNSDSCDVSDTATRCLHHHYDNDHHHQQQQQQHQRQRIRRNHHQHHEDLQQQQQGQQQQRCFIHDVYRFVIGTTTTKLGNSATLGNAASPASPASPATTAANFASPATTAEFRLRFPALLLVLGAALCVTPASCMSREIRVDPSAKQLHHDLMSTYNALVKPSGGPSNQLTVNMGLRLSQVLDVDEKNQIITISVWLRQEWSDLRLKWDPTDYGGVRKLNIPSDDLWKPDIVLYNNADGDFVVTLKTKATVHYNGNIVWEPPAIYKSYCPIDVEYFPFDIQECFMKFSSWTYHFDEVDLQHVCNGSRDRLVIPRGIDMKDYHYNVEWDVLNVTAKRNLRKYPCCPERYPDITFTIVLRRRTLFYTLNLIMPCISISCLTVLVFYLPSDSGEKITLSISILLALTVFFLLLSDMNPPTSLVIPLIGKYLLFIMIVVVASIFLTVYSLHVNFKTPSTDKMTPWVRRIFTEILPKVLLMKRPDVNKGLSSRPPATPPMGGASNKAPNGIEAPSEGGDWGPYENVRQRHESGESGTSCSVDNYPPGPRLQPDVMNALKGLRYIADHLRQGDTDLAEERDWKYISMVIDRFFLYIFTTACFVGTLSIFLYAPSLYDPRNHLALVDPNSTCQY